MSVGFWRGVFARETDLVLLVLLRLVGEGKLECLPDVEIGHVRIVLGVVVDFSSELLLLLAGWDTSVGYISLHGSVRLAIVRYSLQEGGTSGSGPSKLCQ